MESERFDGLVREAAEGATRRGVMRVGVGALAASALVSMGLLADDADARKKKKRKKKKRCKGNRPVKCGSGCCPENFSQCCDNAWEATNSNSCNPADYTCCPVDLGGGSCRPDEPQCCGPTTDDPFGFCAPTDAVCCTSTEGGGWCGEGTVCCPVTENFAACCPDAADCCDVDEDCEGTDTCEGGCCEALVESAEKSAKGRNRKGHTARFRKNAR